jgi:hypothetical protein
MSLYSLVNSRSFCQVDRLNNIPEGAGHYNKGIHATELPAPYVSIGYIRGVVHDVWIVHGDDPALSSGLKYVLSMGHSMYETPALSGAL